MRTTSSANETDGTESTEYAIRAEDVHVTYGDGTEAVQGVDLAVRTGEFFGFLGPNGAGKTTTIETLVTLLYPTRGSVWIGGYEVTENPQAVRESVGYMAQETSVDEELTARENVRLACEVHGVPEDQRSDRIETLLNLVGLDDVADERAETFSGGTKKRLDAATVLVHHPPVVFLDEPTTGMDPEARMGFWEYLTSINQRGTTVFLTTQYLEEIDRLCDSLALIQDGEIVATDTPESLKSAVGGDVVELTLGDAPDAAVERARAVVEALGTVDARTVETTGDGLAITADDAREVVSDLFLALDEAGIAVDGFDVRSPTLDDVFLQITGEDPDAGETDATADGRREVVR